MFFKKWFGPSTKQISTDTLSELLKEKNVYYFLDVRTKQEFKGNSIRGFNNIPVQNLEQNLSKIPKDKEIVVICQSGGRSSMACKMLKKAGFEHVTNVIGGMNNWRGK